MKKLIVILLGLFTFCPSVWSVATFSRVKTWATGDTLTASDLNAEFDNIINNLVPEGIDDYSASTTEMRSVADPYPSSAESLATSLEGELERLRYQILELKKSIQPSNVTYWYQDTPTAGVFTISGSSVGINDTSPSYALDVTGGINATGDISSSGSIYSSGYTVNGNFITTGTMTAAVLSETTKSLVVASTTSFAVDDDAAHDIAADESYDRSSEWNGTTFTATTSGYYRFSTMGSICCNSGDTNKLVSVWLDIRKNGVTQDYAVVFTQPATAPINCFPLNSSRVLSLSAGDQVFYREENITASSSADPNVNFYLAVEKLSGV
jgi:hypothetical protein